MATYSYCGNLPVIASSSIPQTNPIIVNVTIVLGDLNTEKTYVIPNGTKKITIKHRDSGGIDFSFIIGLTNYIELPKGTIYSETDLNMQNETLYYRTGKVGIIEILTWS